MKKFFTLSIFAMIAMLAFAQNPMSKMTKTEAAAMLENLSGIQMKRQAVTTAVSGPKKDAGDVMNIEVDLDGAEYYGAPDYDWYVVFTSKDKVYRFVFDIMNQPSDALPAGTYTLKDMHPDYAYMLVLANREYHDFADVSLTVTDTDLGREYSAVGTLDDGTVVNMTCPIANYEITSEKTVEFSAAETGLDDYTSSSGMIQLYGEKADGFYANAVIYTDQIAGTYTFDDIYPAYTKIFQSLDDMIGVDCFDFKAIITEEKANVEFYGKDGVLYHLIFNIPAKEPVVIPTTLVLTGEINDKTSLEKDPYIEIYAEDSVNPLVVGFVINTDKFATGEFGVNEIDDYYSYVGIIGDDGKISDYYDYISGTGQLAINESTFTWSGIFQMQSENTDEVLEFNITITGPLVSGNQYDNAKEGFDAKYSWDNVTVNDTYASSYGIIFVQATNAAGTEKVSLQFNCTDASNGIPAGVYTIDTSWNEGTVAGTELVLTEGSIEGSFAGNINPTGQITVPLWFINSGTVTVEEGEGGNPHILVDAKNTWDLPVTIEIGAPVANAIKDVNAVSQKTQKVVRNGQFRILTAGKEYNAKGMLIK